MAIINEPFTEKELLAMETAHQVIESLKQHGMIDERVLFGVIMNLVMEAGYCDDVEAQEVA
jgi:hypothetical protein